MTVLSRGARVRRGGRRPGWVLLTALLVLAMGASSALVFTNRVELLKLAVILALWAAVAGAFVSVLYRRQSDADQSRVRDLKLVYDLQLDREISARREYELTVESQLRRELASELRAQAADDVAALRAELAALRTSLEILFDTDLQDRPALETLETEAPRARTYSDWERNGESADWVSSDRMTSAYQDNPLGRHDRRADEEAIIDVPEEPLLPPRQAPPPREASRSHYDVPPEAPYLVSQEPPYMAPPPQPEQRFEQFHRPPQPAPPPPAPPPPPQPEPQPQTQDWQPVAADGLWLPPGARGSHWAGGDSPGRGDAGDRRARHSHPNEPVDGARVEPEPSWPYGEPDRRASRHSAEYRDLGNYAPTNEPPYAPPPPPPAAATPLQEPPMSPPAAPPPPQMAPPPPAAHAPRHGGADPSAEAQQGTGEAPPSGGHSVADLLARLQVEPSGGGRRRRREG
ncbi:DUF6779 domain-containing protein [Mycobacterium sp. IS-1264]|uniref:DUF6779 domain-containing protein n=1 Tax=Mycobacterium sp. IS-1264 TaxID=1834158 RepID=UPI00096DE5E4|nr:DUF6779 domain-containing protein [Mycobacterium sp. IS-1264]OMC40348.1 hypothetical protein A5744_20050 [Mycobacterium sp. IS-1264]